MIERGRLNVYYFRNHIHSNCHVGWELFHRLLSLYGAFFWYITKGTRSSLERVCQDLVDLRVEIDKIDKRKVEHVVYLDDKDRAEAILKTLQTTDRCMLMQRACIGSISPMLTDMKADLKQVLTNQEEISGLKSVLHMVVDRQQEVIKRIDGHLNGHSHK